MLSFLVTRLNHEHVQLIHQLRPVMQQTQSMFIRDAGVLSLVHTTKLLRLQRTESFELLAIHEEIAVEHYAFVLTLLLKQLSGEQTIVQIREPKRIRNIVIGLYNDLTSTTLYPCVFFTLSNPNPVITIPLQCFINSLPREDYQIS